MPKILSLLLTIGASLAAGAGGGAAVVTLLPHDKAPAEREPIEVGDGKFVTLGALLIPIRIADGTLTAYASVEPQIEVAAEDEEGVKARLPLIINAVNMRAFETPLAAGPDDRLPNAAEIRRIVSEESVKVLGRGSVRSVALTRLSPA